MSPLVSEFFISLGLGVAANLNPCVLPLYPGYLAYLSNKPGIADKQRFARISGFVILGGLLTFMIIIGAITAGLGLSISRFVSIASPIAFGVLIAIGVLLILNVEFNAILPQMNVPVLANPFASAFLYGFFYGPIVIPCNAPLVFAVFAYSVGISGFLNRFILFLAFGLGLGIPLLILSFTSTTKGSWLIRKFNNYRWLVNRVAGILLILISLYELIFVFRSEVLSLFTLSR